MAPTLRASPELALDSTLGFGASFLEEAFGGLVRKFGRAAVREKLRFETVDRAYLLPEIEKLMDEAGGAGR